MNGSPSALVIDNLSAGYGDTQVLWDVSLRVDPGEVVALIGSNGAGKSTMLGAISGIVTTWGGAVRYGETTLTGLQPDRIVSEGDEIIEGIRIERNGLLKFSRRFLKSFLN